MKKKSTHCMNCGNEGTVERKRCGGCLKIYNIARSKSYLEKLKATGRTQNRYGRCICEVCKKSMIKNRPHQTIHGACKPKHYNSGFNYNEVARNEDGSATMGRQTVLDMGIKIPKGFIVHHIDENPDNNKPYNLMLMSRSHHIKLHQFLKKNWDYYLSCFGKKFIDGWGKIKLDLTKTYIDTMLLKIKTITARDSIADSDNLVYVFADTLFHVEHRYCV